MRDEKLEELPIHQSLIRSTLILDVERKIAIFVLFMAVLFVIAFLITGFQWYLLATSAVIAVGGMWGGRLMAKKDPHLFEVYNRYKNYITEYPATTKTMVNSEIPASSEMSKLLPYGSLIRPDVVLNKDGSLTSCFFYQGRDVDSSTNSNRNVIASQVRNAVARLGSGWTIQVDTIRVQENDYPHPSDSHFRDVISKLIERERRESFEAEGNHFITINALTVTFLPPVKNESRLLDAFIKTNYGEEQASFATRHLKTFDAGIQPFIDQLSTHLSIERMSTYTYTDEDDQDHNVSNLLQYLNYCLTGENYEIEIPDEFFHIDSLLSYHNLAHRLTPKIDDTFIGVVNINGFPQRSMPNILRALDALPMEYRINFRFVAKDPYDARKIVAMIQKAWQQKRRGFTDQLFDHSGGGKLNRDAVQMDEDAEAVFDDINKGHTSYGYFTACIVLRDKNMGSLETNCESIQKALRNLCFDGLIEGVNTTEAFLGSLPGETKKNVRRPVVSSGNMTHLISLASIWAGRKTNPCPYYPANSPPLMYGSTSGSTPFRVNLHSGDVGHTLILGMTGGGKSTLVTTMITQATRYKNSQVIVFDKGRSAQPIIQAMGGAHYNIGAEDSLEFYPFSNVDGSKNDFLFCVDLVEHMMILSGCPVTPERRADVIRALNLLKGQEIKTFTDFLNTLSDPEIKTALEYYDHNGAFALMSGDPQEVPFHEFATCFEMQELMSMSEKLVLPVILYLFHEIQKRLDGRPTYLFMAEVWTFFSHTVFRAKIVRYLKELRKLNCVLVMDTQSLNDVFTSGLYADIMDNVSTLIFLPNSEAMNKGTAENPGPFEFYTSFGLNPTQINIIKNATAKREYYFSHKEGNRIFNMNLGPVALSFTGMTGAEDLNKMEQLRLECGDEWPMKWMDYNNVDYHRHLEN